MREDEWKAELATEIRESENANDILLEIDTKTKNPMKRQKLNKLMPKKKEEKRDDLYVLQDSSSESEGDDQEENEDDKQDENESHSDQNKEKASEEMKPVFEIKPRRRDDDDDDAPKAPKRANPLPVPQASSSYIAVTRDPAIQAAREKLPIVGEEQAIMEAINENPVVILAGETGSGKTTQVS